MMSATLLGVKPDLVDNLVCVGGVYDIHKKVMIKTNFCS